MIKDRRNQVLGFLIRGPKLLLFLRKEYSATWPPEWLRRGAAGLTASITNLFDYDDLGDVSQPQVVAETVVSQGRTSSGWSRLMTDQGIRVGLGRLELGR